MVLTFGNGTRSPALGQRGGRRRTQVNANIGGVSTTIFAILVGWGAWALVSHRIRVVATRGDLQSGLTIMAIRAYARLWHGLRVRGAENIPARSGHGPIVVVSNHTAGVDPLLIQAACGFEVRWVMAEDMRLPWLDEFWLWAGVIFVDRANPSTAPVRSAMAHLRGGGVLGLFPEAHIERPPRTLLPFHAGVGALVRQTGARVLPVVIEGTPTSPRSAWGSLFTPSRARLRFFPPIDYGGAGLSPAEIAEDLRSRYAAWTGWPLAASPGESDEGYAGYGGRRARGSART